jgi:Protein of unknown function (DUF3551)
MSTGRPLRFIFKSQWQSAPKWRKLAAPAVTNKFAGAHKARGGIMWYYALVGAALVVAASADRTQAAIIYPWCAHYMMANAPNNCGFATLEQCRMTVAGIGGTCQANPFYATSLPAAAPPTSRRHRSRRG